MNRSILLLLLGLLCSAAQGQVVTLLQNGSSTFFYNVHDLNTVINAAHDGDTIVLPGGPITPNGNMTLTKRLVWVGAGYRPDTTQVTTPTVFTAHPLNQIFVQEGASGSRFHGIRFDRLLQIGADTPQQVTDIGLTRCEFTSGLRLAAALGYSATNVQIRQCVIRQGIHVPQGMGAGALNAPQGLLVENSIIAGSIDLGGALTTGTVTNSILLTADLSSPAQNNGLAYTNCIFANTANNVAVNNPSYFEHCLFAHPSGALPSWGASAIQLVGNTSSTLNATNVFINVPEWSSFAYVYDYRLTPITSPALNMGATDSGIYGGSWNASWKPGGIPFNPHWISLSPSLNPTEGGVINVNLSGAAQQY